MKVSEKMCLKIILKVTKDQGFTLSLEDTFSKNHRGGQIDPPPITPPTPPAVLGLKFFMVLFHKILK